MDYINGSLALPRFKVICIPSVLLKGFKHWTLRSRMVLMVLHLPLHNLFFLFIMPHYTNFIMQIFKLYFIFFSKDDDLKILKIYTFLLVKIKVKLKQIQDRQII